MAKDEPKAPPTRAELDQAVADAQAAVLAPAKAETEAQRAARLAAAKAHRRKLDDAVFAAQVAELKPSTPESQEDRDARIAADRAFVLERQRDVADAVDAENRARAAALGLPAPMPSPDARPA